MFSFFKNYFRKRAIKRRLRRLKPEERMRILENSSYEAAGFQGEGFHVFRKLPSDEYITSLGEISPQAAEDWLIMRYWEENNIFP